MITQIGRRRDRTSSSAPSPQGAHRPSKPPIAAAVCAFPWIFAVTERDTGPRNLRAWPSESDLADGCHQLSAVGLPVERHLSARQPHHARPDARYAADVDVRLGLGWQRTCAPGAAAGGKSGFSGSLPRCEDHDHAASSTRGARSPARDSLAGTGGKRLPCEHGRAPAAGIWLHKRGRVASPDSFIGHPHASADGRPGAWAARGRGLRES